jgi:predicted dehydrogenase
MTPKNKYYRTQWRRSGAFPGGFLVDGGVHHAAVLRMLLGDIASVQAMVTQATADLPPLDTVSATIRFANGALGAYLNTFAAGTPFASALTIVGDRGSMRVERGRIETADQDGAVQVIECENYNGVLNELAAFAASVKTGAPHNNTPEQALDDLTFMEAILSSAQSGV